jgi:hypothetical protein
MLRHMTFAGRITPMVRSPWFPRAVLAMWVVLFLVLALMTRTSSGPAQTVAVVALLLGAACLVGWYVIVLRARRGTRAR